MLLEGYKVTSGYGYRKDPIGSGQDVFHPGIDMVKEHKAPIYAFAGGTVVFAGLGKTGSGLGGYGNVVLIKDLNGYGHLYAHLDSVVVTTGAQVSKGQMIGRQGATGQVTGSHLHYEIRRETSPSYGWSADKSASTIDPIAYLKLLDEEAETTENKPSQHENIPIHVTKYELKKETSGYVTAADAKAGKNKKTTVKPGIYLVYKTSGGMINVTTKNGTLGSWINPYDEVVEGDFKEGQKVKITSKAKIYSRSTVSIPSKYKNKSYTIQQVGNADVLIKELYSWVKKADLQ